MKLKDRIWQVLEKVPSPDPEHDIVSSGLVQNVAECGGRVAISLAVGHLPEAHQQALVGAVQQAVSTLAGVRWVRVKVGR